MSRIAARTAAMQMIFEKVSGGQGGEDALRMVYEELRNNDSGFGAAIQENEPDASDREYISAAIHGVLDHLSEIDEVIRKTAIGWNPERMSLVDLTVLRLAVWEILFEPEVPDNVAVSEALRLTEIYSDPNDKSFVNGILGTVVRLKEVQE